MESFRLASTERHASIDILRIAIGNGGIAIGKGSSPGAIGETLRAIEMMQQLNTALSWANEQGHIEPSARWQAHSLFVETLRNMGQKGKRPDAWSVDRRDTRAYHSELRVLRADADAP